MKKTNRKSGLMVLCALIPAGMAVAQESPDRGGSLNLQFHGNAVELLYGKTSSLVQNLPMTTLTLEGNGWDPIGSTYFFIDFEAVNAADPSSSLMGMYFEFSREWCFWKNASLSGLSLHTEIDQVVGYGMMPGEFTTNLLPGVAYGYFAGHGFAQVQLLYRHSWSRALGHAPGAQLTFVGNYTPVKWFELSGFADFSYDSDPYFNNGLGWKIAVEPYLWFRLCPAFSIGTRCRFTYNMYQDFLADAGPRFYFVPSVSARWTIF